MPLLVLAAALLKDVVVILGCLVIYSSTRQLVVNPRATGKVCTFVQMFMVAVMLLGPDFPPQPDVPRAVWTVAGALAILATIDYTVDWCRRRTS